MRPVVLAAALAVALSACSAPADEQSASPSASPSPTGFAVTSPDFVDGAELADWATANAYGGQCVGENLNPALSWTNVPEGTQAFAITLIDRTGSNYIHWVQFDIPGDSLGIERGASTADGGVEGATSEASPGYFGPCPPDPDHQYEFTVYALDAPLGLETGANFVDVSIAIGEHTLAAATITGMRSGPA
jgi:Raf kinase inhibitor-like YbhB/YbcL family protein